MIMDKKKVVVRLLLILVIVVIVLLLLTLIDKAFSKKVDSDLVVTLKSDFDDIKFKDKLPLEDELGKKIKYDSDNSDVQGYYEFEVKATKGSGYYEIYAVEDEIKKGIYPNYIKVYLTDDNNDPVDGYENVYAPTFYKLTTSSINPNGRRLYYGYIKEKQTKKFILRSWISDAYITNYDTRSFGFKVYAEAE